MTDHFSSVRHGSKLKADFFLGSGFIIYDEQAIDKHDNK